MSNQSGNNRNNPIALPILYSLRNCPYAMRARLAIFKSKLAVELRDIVLSNKPEEMTLASPKATVPVVVLPTSEVIDESLNVMLWALEQNDPQHLLPENKRSEILALIQQFDEHFKSHLEAYKCAKRYHETNLEDCRRTCEIYILQLEQRLTEHLYLTGNSESMADIALLPFIRQFAKVERQWYVQSPYPQVKRWLNQYLQSAMFTKVMAKYPLWTRGQPIEVFGNI